MARGMKAEYDLGAWGFFDAEALCIDGHPTIGADLQGGSNTPHIVPPRAARGWAQDGAFLLFGLIPGMERCLAQFAMDFLPVAMGPQGVDVGVGHVDIGYFFTGEVGGKASLPELMFALDLAFGLRCWGITQADVVELERPAQLSKGVGVLGEEDGVIIDIDLKRTAVNQKGGGQEIKIGDEQFALIKFGPDEQPAAVIEHIEHGKRKPGVVKPSMGRGIQLPEFADLRALPATDRGSNPFGG